MIKIQCLLFVSFSLLFSEIHFYCVHENTSLQWIKKMKIRTDLHYREIETLLSLHQ